VINNYTKTTSKYQYNHYGAMQMDKYT